MKEMLTLVNKMKDCNPYAIVTSAAHSRKWLLEILEVDRKGTLWCWVEEEDFIKMHVREPFEVSLEWGDKYSGRQMEIKGVAAEMNFYPAYMALLFKKNKCGYLWKIAIREMEYYKKDKVPRYLDPLHSVRKHSMAILNRVREIRFRKRDIVPNHSRL